jgi:hypothetical protein
MNKIKGHWDTNSPVIGRIGKSQLFSKLATYTMESTVTRKHVLTYCYQLKWILHSFISIILAFDVVTKEHSKSTQFAFNHRGLSVYEESQARNIQ